MLAVIVLLVVIECALAGKYNIEHNSREDALNLRPIIGIISEPDSDSNPTIAFMSASYVQWIQSAGARVALIPFDANETTLSLLMSSINGLLFTGGDNTLESTTKYFQTSKFIFNKAIEMNDKGNYFPVWGTCQGFQLLSILVAQDYSVLIHKAFDSYNLPLALEPTRNFAGSKFFRNCPKEIIYTLTKTNSTENLHQDGLYPETYTTNARLKQFFNLLSTNRDRKGLAFGSTIEAYNYPVFATQWHPERNQFQWGVRERTFHTPDAIHAMQWLANFFVQECRKNFNQFPDAKSEMTASIYNYCSNYTGPPYDTGSAPQMLTYWFPLNNATNIVH